jgi:hypothetical protein
MATFSAAVTHVKERLELCLATDFIFKTCREVGHEWRNTPLNPAVTIHAILLQLLASVALRGLRHVANITQTAQAICNAKMRLPLKLFVKLVEYSLPKDFAAAAYKGLKIYLVDGMGFTVADTPPLARKYGKSTNQTRKTPGYPTPKLLALMEAGAGYIGKAIILPYARQEYTCLSRLFKFIDPGSLLMGDRGLVSFVHLAMLMAQGLQGCFRLPRGRIVHGRGTGSRRLKKRLGKQDLLVTWEATRRPKWMSKKRWEKFAQQTLTLRQISFRVCRKGFRTNWAWIITTLLDPEQHPAQKLIELYSERWQIEVYFRDLKCTLNMKKISVKTVKGVQKEVLAFILLYNLIRKVMQEAAERQGVAPDRIGFKDATLWLLYSAPGTPPPKLVVNPRRERATQARRVKKGRRRFPQLNQSRAASCKPRCKVKI